jgi:uncharacterized protein (TIGR02145 family)
LTIVLSCKKNDPDWRKYEIVLSDIDLEQTGKREATVRYSMKIIGSPTPEILEFGLIVSGDPEAPFFGTRYPSSELAEKGSYEQYLTNMEGDTRWYVRSYVVTYHDTILSKINSFQSGNYYTEGAGVTDVEGNFYKTVLIGTQEWMAESLRTRTFCNGDTMVLGKSTAVFGQFDNTTPIALSLDFDSSNDTIYGKYYPGMVAFDDRNICPCGWKIPTKSDIVDLANFVGNNQYLGAKMKSTGILEEGTGLWLYPNVLGNNLTGLNVHPGGDFSKGGNYFSYVHSTAQIMFTEPHVNNNGVMVDYPYSLVMQYIRREVDIYGVGENVGFINIRCVRE